MDPARWRAISDLASVAAETAPEERQALLASQPELRDEVESLLRYLEEGSGPLDREPAAPGDGESQASLVGREIGPYHVVRELGQGGMGLVLLARRANVGFEQLVALKIARVAFQSDFFARRFVDEQRILARLEHPNIARLLDGGVTADGTPYLAMQYVEGEPLDQWCARQNLNVREKIALFLKVCEAVEYAHEHLVVHRDLKPSNILVTPAGEPMLLDFGTARLVEASDTSGATRTVLPMMTLRYASPEQVSGLAGSTRTDVYSLSVLLYELLTDRWPYREENESSPARARVISETDAIPPSRSGGPGTAALAGDLDAILIKGLEKPPDRRYGTAARLADDLKRYLAGEPVSARQPTFAYRAGKFLRRHWAAAATSGAVAIALAAATFLSVRQARIADRERLKAEAVAGFVERLLGASREGQVTPLASRGRDLKVVEIIDDAAKTVGTEFASNPGVEAGLRSTIGSTYMALGDNSQAGPHVDRAVRLSEQVYGMEHVATARAWTARGRLRMAAGDYAGAKEDLSRSLAVLTREKSSNLSFLRSLLGETMLRLGDATASRQYFEAALADMRRNFGDNHLATATMINNLGVVSEETGDQAAAERNFEDAARIMRGLRGPPPNLVHTLIGLQRSLYYRREFAQAKAVCEEAYRVALAQSGDKHRNTATAMSALAVHKSHLGEPDAEELSRKAVELQRTVYPEGHYEISRGLTQFGRVLLIRGGKAAEAERVLREALEIARKAYPRENWRPAESRLLLGLAIRAQGRHEEARQQLDAGLREMEAVLPASHPRVLEARRFQAADASMMRP